MCTHTHKWVQVKSMFLQSLSFHSHKKKYGACLQNAIIYLFFCGTCLEYLTEIA